MMALGDEYTRRYGKQHLTIIKCADALCVPPSDMPNTTFVPPPQCMPDEFKHEDTITAYWNYYVGEKHSVANKNERIYFKPFIR